MNSDDCPAAPAADSSASWGVERGWPAWYDYLTGLSLLAAVALFAWWPDLDLQVSRALYAPGAGFIWRDLPVVRSMYLFVPWLVRGLVMVAALYWLAGRFRLVRRTVAAGTTHAAALGLVAALIGPGLLVEGVLKPGWQRPRPVQVVEFGGQHAYAAPFQYCHDCHTHHSFVSSHAAAGFALLLVGLGGNARQRCRWLLAGMLAGTAVGAGRLAQGGHFLSDIVFAFYAVWLPAQVVLWWDARRPSKLPAPRSPDPL